MVDTLADETVELSCLGFFNTMSEFSKNRFFFPSFTSPCPFLLLVSVLHLDAVG